MREKKKKAEMQTRVSAQSKRALSILGHLFIASARG